MTWIGGIARALSSLLKAAPGWLLGALGALTALALAYRRGRSAGQADELARAGEVALERKEEAERLEHEIESLSAPALDERGEPWVRR